MVQKHNASLVEVTYENNNKTASMLFYAEECGVMDIKLNTQSYNTESKKWYDDAEKANQIEELCQNTFGCSFDGLESCLEKVYSVYSYERKDGELGYSLTEPEEIASFDEDMVGQIFQTKVDKVTVDANGIHLYYKIDDKTYRTNHSFTRFLPKLNKSYPDENKRRKALKTFEDRYGVPVEEKDSIVGHDLIVECKQVGGEGGACYGETKKFPAKKGKK